MFLLYVLSLISIVTACAPVDGTCRFIGEQCESNSVCATGICNFGRCSTDNRAQPCARDSDCKGYMSSVFCVNSLCQLNAVAMDSCKHDLDCLGSMKCTNSMCVPLKMGSSCSHSEECDSDEWCSGGRCTAKIARYGECTYPSTCLHKMDECISGSCTEMYTADEGQTCAKSLSCKHGLVCSSVTGTCEKHLRVTREGCQTCVDGIQNCGCNYQLSNAGVSQCYTVDAETTECVGERLALTMCTSFAKCTPNYSAYYWGARYRFSDVGARSGQCARRECGEQLAAFALCQSRATGQPINCTEQIKKVMGITDAIIEQGGEYTITGATTEMVPLNGQTLMRPAPNWVWLADGMSMLMIIGALSIIVIAYFTWKHQSRVRIISVGQQ
jgi:hypothetical protein